MFLQKLGLLKPIFNKKCSIIAQFFLYVNIFANALGLSMNGMWLYLHVPTHASVYLGVLLLHV